MHHFITEICTRVHISVKRWCIVGYLSDALWDLWDESIDIIRCWIHKEYHILFVWCFEYFIWKWQRNIVKKLCHMSIPLPQNTDHSTVCSTAYPGNWQRNHQKSPRDSPHKGTSNVESASMPWRHHGEFIEFTAWKHEPSATKPCHTC